MSFFLIGIVTTLVLYGVNEMVTLFVIVPVAIILIALQYTWAKKKD
jgi:hypothetical protein